MAEEDEFELQMPLGGVSDDLAFSRQDLGTTREAFNARGQDPKTGRERISQRSGLSLANTGQLDGSNRILEMASVVFDTRNLTYAALTSEAEEWSTVGPKKETVRHGVTDSQGSIYFTDGASGIAKLNPDGELVWQFPLPVADKGHSIRFVYVDDLFDVYVGVSSTAATLTPFGTRPDLGQFWKLTQLPDDEVELAWEVRPGAYVEEAKVYRDKLYTLQNNPSIGKAYIRVYKDLDAAAPSLAQEWRVPWPANGMDLNEAGDVFVASARGGSIVNFLIGNFHRVNPKWPRTSTGGRPLAPEVVDWTPYDLDDFERRVWSWFMAEDISVFDVFGALAQDVPIQRWPDRSGKNRHLYEPSSIGKKPPTLAFNALGTRPGVRFDGTQALVSLANSSIKKQYADTQKTVWPAYEGSMFLSIFVVRPEKRDSGNPFYIFEQSNTASGASDHVIAANRSDGNTIPGTFLSGVITHFATTAVGDPGRGTNGHPKEASFDNDHDAAIIAILWDGGITPGDTTKTRSLFQLNGAPVDRYEGKGNTTKDPSILGSGTQGGAIDDLSGDVLAIFTLDMMDRDSTAEPKVLTHDKLEDTDADVDQTDNELTKLVGYFAHYFGLSHLLPRETQSYTHPYGCQTETFFGGNVVDLVCGPPPDGDLGAWGRSIRDFWCLTKWSPTGDLVWTLNGEEPDPLSSSNGVVGVGYGVRVDKDGNLFSIGPTTTFWDNTPSTNRLLKVIDKGTTFSLAAVDGAWGVAIASPTYLYPRMAVDPTGNVYVPVDADSTVQVFKGTDGTQLHTFQVGDPVVPSAVAIDPRIPNYGDDIAVSRARFVYVFGGVGTAKDHGITKVRLVAETPLSGSPREHVHLGISAGGLIKTFAVGGASYATPSGAAGALSTTPFYVQSVPAFEKVYITDGVSKIQVFDPREDTVAPLESTTPGGVPHGAKLVELWRGRLFWARAPGLIGGAFDWAASRVAEPTDYNNFPPSRDPASAIAGENSAGPGMCPDIINTLIPLSDDFLLFGCDHSIFMLSGDPGDGGQFDIVSEVTGIAFGRPWCKDPEGNVWFIGSRGGLFAIAPGGRPIRVSERNIDERLSRINFETHYVRLAWNDRDKGVHIMRFPFGTPGDPVEHWFWDKKRAAPWPDTFGTETEPDIEPTAIYVVDGDDPDDRLVLLGGRDGRIRKWDVDANDDDGTAIDFSVLAGPLAGSEAAREMRFVGPRVVLASDQDGAIYQLYATDDPAILGSPRASGILHPGRNPLKRAKMRGSHCFVRVRNSVAGQRCAIESVHMRAHPAGQKRVRNTP